MVYHKHNTTRKLQTGGFSMVEFAIVLGVIGIVLGALWAAVSTAWEYTRREQLHEAIATTVANARSYLSGQAGVPKVSLDALTDQLITANVIPNFLKRSALCTGSGKQCADNPWTTFNGGVLDPYGTYRVCNWALGDTTDCTAIAAPAGISPFFGIALTGLTKKVCIALVEAVSSATEPTGLVEININGTNLVSTAAPSPIQPVSDATVLADCTAADGSNYATFVYRAVAPQP